MKEIKLESNAFDHKLRMSFSIPTRFGENGNIIGMSPGALCREQVISRFVSAISHSKIFAKTLNKSRVVLHRLSEDDISTVRIKKVLTTINAIEEEANLPYTTAKRVKNNKNPSYNMIMFEGPIQWYRSSHTMSLWFLIIRLSIECHEKFHGNSFKKLTKAIKSADKIAELKKYPTIELAQLLRSNGWNWLKSDLYYTYKTMDSWIPLMSNLDAIFPFRQRWKDRYNKNKVFDKPEAGHYHASCHLDGILNLSTGFSKHKRRHIFNEIMKGNKS